MGKKTKGYQDCVNTVVYERLTGDIPESYSNEWMQRGNDLEAEARTMYELETFNKVHIVGFVESDEWIGCSPDGLIGDKGLLQIKCPKYNTFINYALFHKAVEDYIIQCQGELLVTERNWNDLFIYHPKLQPLVYRIKRDEEIIKGIDTELKIAIELAKERIKTIKDKK
jgi:hypothetical protein